jgi:hypothetical protein
MRHLVFLLLILSLALSVACSKKDDDNPTGPENNNPPSPPPTVSTNVPTNAPDYLQGMASIADMYSQGGFAYISMAYATQGTQTGNTWTWSVTSETVTVTLQAMIQADGSTTWKIILNGTENQHTYVNWVMIEGQVSADQKSASWTAYEDGTQNVAATWDMSIDEGGNTTSTIVIDNLTYEFVSNVDGSGSYKEYENETIIYEAAWNSTGAGTWIAYNDDGSVADSDSWT